MTVRLKVRHFLRRFSLRSANPQRCAAEEGKLFLHAFRENELPWIGVNSRPRRNVWIAAPVEHGNCQKTDSFAAAGVDRRSGDFSRIVDALRQRQIEGRGLNDKSIQVAQYVV